MIISSFWSTRDLLDQPMDANHSPFSGADHFVAQKNHWSLGPLVLSASRAEHAEHQIGMQHAFPFHSDPAVEHFHLRR